MNINERRYKHTKIASTTKTGNMKEVEKCLNERFYY
jgi:hypothetical protein